MFPLQEVTKAVNEKNWGLAVMLRGKSFQHLQGVDRTEATNPVLAGNRLELCHHAHQSSVLWDERIRQFPAG